MSSGQKLRIPGKCLWRPPRSSLLRVCSVSSLLTAVFPEPRSQRARRPHEGDGVRVSQTAPPSAAPHTGLGEAPGPSPTPTQGQLCLIRSLVWKRHCGQPERPDRKVLGVLATAGSSPGSACETESDFQAEKWGSQSAPAGVVERGLGLVPEGRPLGAGSLLEPDSLSPAPRDPCAVTPLGPVLPSAPASDCPFKPDGDLSGAGPGHHPCIQVPWSWSV